MNNALRSELLAQTKKAQQLGFKGSIMDVLSNPTVLQEFTQQQNRSRVEVASTPQQQQQGLSGVPANQMPEAMVFPNVKPNTSFNTEDMLASINIKKYDNQGHLVKSYNNVPPGITNLPMGPQGGTVIETPANVAQSGGRKKYQATGPKNKQVDLRVSPYTTVAESTGTQAPVFQSREDIEAQRQSRFFNQTVQEADRVAAITGDKPNYEQAKETVTTGRQPTFVTNPDDPKYQERAKAYRDKYGIEIDDPSVLERLANPMAQLEYYNRYGSFPNRAQMDLDSTYGNPMDLAGAIYNPFSYVQSAMDAGNAASEGNYGEAALSGLGVIPGYYGIKGIQQAAPHIQRGVKQLNRALNTAPPPNFQHDVGAGPLMLFNRFLRPKANTPIQLPGSGNTFKSEIDWRNWVKYKEDFDNNPDVIQNLLDIERRTKADGTWMKNADGSPFQGTREEFVVQQSDRWKEAYGNGADVVYRGGDPSPTLTHYKGSSKGQDPFFKTKFTFGDPKGAAKWTPGINESTFSVPKDNLPDQFLSLYSPKTSKKLTLNTIDPYYKDPTSYTRIDIRHQIPSQILEDFKSFIQKNYPIKKYGDQGDITKDWLHTDQFAHFLETRPDLDRIEFSKIFDGTIDAYPVNIHQQKPGNFLKSTRGNILIDLNNPDIYKALVPTVLGTAAAAAVAGSEPKMKDLGKVTFQTGGPTNPPTINQLFQGVPPETVIEKDPITGEELFYTNPNAGLPPKFDYKTFQRGVSFVESKDGKYMKNPNSSATGLYGQLYNEVKNLPELEGISRDDFAADTALQNKILELRVQGKISGIPGIQESAETLYNQYSSQIPNFPYNVTEVGAFVNFLGREGTRKYFGRVLRDKENLGTVFPNFYGENVTVPNKTPEQYITEFRTVRKYGGPITYQNGGPTDPPYEEGKPKTQEELNYAKRYGQIKPPSSNYQPAPTIREALTIGPNARDGFYEPTWENFLEFFDPTGALSHDDARDAYAKMKARGATFPNLDEGLDMFGAVPLLGKLKYAGIILKKGKDLQKAKNIEALKKIYNSSIKNSDRINRVDALEDETGFLNPTPNYAMGGPVKYQNGGLPGEFMYKSQSAAAPLAYDSPTANGYLLPDPNRPELMNTGATEYKMGVDDVTIPTVVNGNYMDPETAYQRYKLTGEKFKPTADPSAYSKFYDEVNKLGIMKYKKGGKKPKYKSPKMY